MEAPIWNEMLNVMYIIWPESEGFEMEKLNLHNVDKAYVNMTI